MREFGGRAAHGTMEGRVSVCSQDNDVVLFVLVPDLPLIAVGEKY